MTDATVTEISVIANWIDNVTKGIGRTQESINRFSKNQVQLNRLMNGQAQKLIDNATAVNNLGKRYDSFAGVMAMPMMQWRRFNLEGGRFSTLGGKFANTIRNWTHGLRGFRMEMLGVMFFGLGMANFFKGLLSPAMELTGIFQIFSTILQVLFLPVAMAILPIALNILDWVLNMSPETKKLIGILVLLGMGLGYVLFWIGSLALGFGSLIQAFGVLASPIAKVIAFIKTLIASFTGVGAGTSSLISSLMSIIPVILLVVAVVYGCYLAFKENFGRMRDWVQVMVNGIKDIFNGLIGIFKGVFQIIIGLVSGNGQMVVDGFKNIFIGIYHLFTGAIKTIIGLVVSLGLGIWRVLTGIFDALKEAFVILINYLIDGINWLTKQISKVTSKIGLGKIGTIGQIEISPKGSFKNGGYVPSEGLYHLHAGETVVPANGGGGYSFSPTVNITSNGTVDIARIRDMLTDQWVSELDRRLARR